jgi:hypothetical protein
MKKAQVQIFETIVVIFIFFILVFIGLIFYGRIAKSDIEKQDNEIAQLRSIAIAQKVMSMPELQCSDNGVAKENCIDMLKLDSAKNVMKGNEIYYYDLLEFSEVNITTIYPNEQKWTVYSRNPGNFRNKFTTNVPVAIYDPVAKKSAFGIITIQTITT